MPIYEYHCLDCKTFFEVLVTSHKAADTVRCVQCGSRKIAKAISAPSCHISPSSGLGKASSGCSSKSGFS